MFVYEPGRTHDRAPNAAEPHYLVSQATEFEWRMLVDGLRAAATLCSGFSPDLAELPEGQAGALFHVFAEHAATLTGEARLARRGQEREA